MHKVKQSTHMLMKTFWELALRLLQLQEGRPHYRLLHHSLGWVQKVKWILYNAILS